VKWRAITNENWGGAKGRGVGGAWMSWEEGGVSRLFERLAMRGSLLDVYKAARSLQIFYRSLIISTLTMSKRF